MAESLFTEEEKKLIVQEIENAEKKTSGEIQVHIENHCHGNVLDRAAEVFSILKMHETELRNGVLIYLAVKDHKFAILGDAGINSVVPSNFWESTKELMKSYFVQNKYALGLCEGIKLSAQQLQKHFPYKNDDTNELSNEISFGHN